MPRPAKGLIHHEVKRIIMEGKPIFILFVEDNLAHTKLVMRDLREHTIANQVRLVTDGQAAMDYLTRQGLFRDADAHPLPDLIRSGSAEQEELMSILQRMTDLSLHAGEVTKRIGALTRNAVTLASTI